VGKPLISLIGTPDRRLALILGGGGARGGAHLGVLAIMEEVGVPIDLMVGTSIGGVIGVLYAAGYSVAAIAEALGRKTLWDVLGPDPSGQALLGSRRLRALLLQLLGRRTFADLTIPCMVVATDLTTCREAILAQGSLVEALLATTALPGLFPPVERAGSLLVDGGLLNNLPIDIARRWGAKKVIAVNLDVVERQFSPTDAIAPAWHWPDPLPRAAIASADRALRLLLAQLTTLHLAQMPADVLLEPAVAHVGTFSMGQFAAAQVAGESAARAAREQLAALRAWHESGTAVGLQRRDEPVGTISG
jgi:NTE family protein